MAFREFTKTIDMNLEKIKKEKTKEAEKLFKKLGIETKNGSSDLQITKHFSYHLINTEDKNDEAPLLWTRLSNNSTGALIIE